MAKPESERQTFFEVEIFGSHVGFNNTSYFSYNKFVIMVGMYASAVKVLSQDTTTTVDLWDPVGSVAGLYNHVDVSGGFPLTIRIVPHCDSRMDYTYIVRYYSGAVFTPSAIRQW